MNKNEAIHQQYAKAQDANIPAFFKQYRIFEERAADLDHNVDRCEDISKRCATCHRHRAEWSAS